MTYEIIIKSCVLFMYVKLQILFAIKGQSEITSLLLLGLFYVHPTSLNPTKVFSNVGVVKCCMIPA